MKWSKLSRSPRRPAAPQSLLHYLFYLHRPVLFDPHRPRARLKLVSFLYRAAQTAVLLTLVRQYGLFRHINGLSLRRRRDDDVQLNNESHAARHHDSGMTDGKEGSYPEEAMPFKDPPADTKSQMHPAFDGPQDLHGQGWETVYRSDW